MNRSRVDTAKHPQTSPTKQMGHYSSVANRLDSNEELLSNDRLINRMFIAAVILGCFVFILAQFRALEIGWFARDYIQFFAVICSIILVICRRKISSHHKVIFLIVVSLLLASVGVFTLGLLGGAIFFFPLATIMITLVYSVRTVAIFVTLLMLFLTIIAVGFTSGQIESQVSADLLLKNPNHWAVYLSCIFFFLIITCMTVFSYRRIMGQLLTEISHQRDKLILLADYDELTSLPLLRLAREHLAMACHRSKRSSSKVALLFADLDDFKEVNDTFGHEAGDYCLKVTSRRMTELVRPYDTVARIGGDEFMLILDDLSNAQGAGRVAKSLIDQVSKPMEYKGQHFSVGISIGIALFPDHSEDIQALKEFADEAMYCAKSSGKNTFAFVGDVSADKLDSALL